MSRFEDIDLSRLPALPLGLDTYDAVRLARLAELTDRLSAAGLDFDPGTLETDPLVIIEEAGAYREILLLARRDDAIRAVLLATSWGPFLDQLGAGQVPPLTRKVMIPADASSATAAVLEDDTSFRRRIQLAPEALSTAGPEGAYLFFALETPGVKTASCYGPMSFGGTPGTPFVPLGEVRVPIVSASGDGTASDGLVAAVQAELSASRRRPLADFVTVSAATIVPYAIVANLTVGAGADPGIVKGLAEARLASQAIRQHRPGAAALRQQFYGAAYVADASGANLVEEVDLAHPAADVNPGPISPGSSANAFRAPFCTSVTVTVTVSDD